MALNKQEGTMELKDRLKKARKEAGLTQKDIENNIPNLTYACPFSDICNAVDILPLTTASLPAAWEQPPFRLSSRDSAT